MVHLLSWLSGNYPMRISHKHKFIYISIPKTGSESIRAAIDDFSDVSSVSDGNSCYFHHITHDKIMQCFDYASRYYTFTFVRNPWSRLVSQWTYMCNYSKQTKCYDWFRSRCCDMINQCKSFSSFVESEYTTAPCYNWLNINNKISVDYVGKLENIQHDYKQICSSLGIDCKPLEHVNKTNHDHYTTYYNDHTRAVVSEKYAIDIKCFDYQFEH